MLLSLKANDESLFMESHSVKLITKLLFCIRVHLSGNNLLKQLVFNLKSGSNVLFISNGGIKATFFPL